jgi:small subunit ribosomal protein S18
MAKKQVTKRRKFQIPVNRFCRFTKAGVKEIDYKDVDTLLKNIDESGKLLLQGSLEPLQSFKDN